MLLGLDSAERENRDQVEVIKYVACGADMTGHVCFLSSRLTVGRVLQLLIKSGRVGGG